MVTQTSCDEQDDGAGALLTDWGEDVGRCGAPSTTIGDSCGFSTECSDEEYCGFEFVFGTTPQPNDPATCKTCESLIVFCTVMCDGSFPDCSVGEREKFNILPSTCGFFYDTFLGLKIEITTLGGCDARYGHLFNRRRRRTTLGSSLVLTAPSNQLQRRNMQFDPGAGGGASFLCIGNELLIGSYPNETAIGPNPANVTTTQGAGCVYFNGTDHTLCSNYTLRYGPAMYAATVESYTPVELLTYEGIETLGATTFASCQAELDILDVTPPPFGYCPLACRHQLFSAIADRRNLLADLLKRRAV